MLDFEKEYSDVINAQSIPRLWNSKITSDIDSYRFELNPGRQEVACYVQPIQTETVGRLYRSMCASWLPTDVKLRHSVNNGGF